MSLSRAGEISNGTPYARQETITNKTYINTLVFTNRLTTRCVIESLASRTSIRTLRDNCASLIRWVLGRDARKWKLKRIKDKTVHIP